MIFLFVNLITVSVNAQTPLTSCETINTPGNYYLANNVSNSNSGNCFTIQANNVELDCQSYVIVVSNGNAFILNYSNYTTIKNCKIYHSSVGTSMNIINTDNIIIENNIIWEYKETAISIHGSNNSKFIHNNISKDNFYFANNDDVILIAGGNNNTFIMNNISSYDSFSDGIYMAGSNDNKIISNSVSIKSYSCGFNFLYFNNSIIESNYIFGNANYNGGICLKGNKNLIKSNNISLYNLSGSSGDSGGLYVSGNNNFIENNKIRIENDDGIGISLSPSSTYGISFDNINNSILFNTILTSEANSPGIILGYSYNILGNNKIMGNKITTLDKISYPYSILNSSYGIRLLFPGLNNSVYNNFINTTTSPNVNVTYTTTYLNYYLNYWNTSLQPRSNIVNGPYIGGNFYAKTDGSGYSETCTDNNSDGICDIPLTHAPNNTDYLPLAKPTFSQVPVILVHGYYGEPNTTWATMKQRLEQDGFTVFAIDLEPTFLPANQHIPIYAQTLKTNIDIIKIITNSSKVDLVTHSMGGLVARWYIQQSNYENDVRKLIMLGTPNHGADILKTLAFLLKVGSALYQAALTNLGLILGGVTIVGLGPAGFEMIPNSPILNLLNCGVILPCPSNIDIISLFVPYYTAAGNKFMNFTSPLAGPIFAFFPLVVNDPHDGFVKIRSVKLDYVPLYIFPVNHTDLHEVNEIYSLVKDILLDKNLEYVIAQENDTITVYLYTITNGALNPGESVSYLVNIDNSTSQISFTSLWTNGTTSLSLINPNSEIINSNTVNPNVSYFIDQAGLIENFFIQAPMSGVWIVNINATDILNQEEYLLFVVGNTTLSLKASVNPSIVGPVQSVIINASLSDVNNLVINSGVSAEIFKPDNSTETINLYDDGMHYDGLANDGVYSNIYNNTDQFGLYLVHINASGSYNNGFLRADTTSFFVELFPDLEVRGSDISLNPNILIPGQNQTVSVSAIIQNIGQADANNVDIEFYDGNPMNNGVMFANSTINVPVNSSSVVTAQFDYIFNPNPSLEIGQSSDASPPVFDILLADKSFKSHDIYAIISSFSDFIELNYSNNIAHKKINFQDTGYILAMSLGTSPGIQLSDGRVIPLNFDDLFLLSFFYPNFIGLQNSQGIFNENGEATATWTIPNFAPSGLTLYFAFITINPNLLMPQAILSISPSISTILT